MKCWVCSREARGYGHLDVRHKSADPRRYPIDWVFCSRRCQNAFHTFYGGWTRAQEDGAVSEVAMVDATPMEQEAMRLCLRFFGEAAAAIGFDKPLGAYSEAEALRVIDAIVTAYVDEMAVQHERRKYPPLRMPEQQPVHDPIRKIVTVTRADFFQDMKNDLPWETK